MPVRLGYDTYSLRSWNWDAFEHLEFAAGQRLNAIQFSGLEAFRSKDPAYLGKVKARATELGIRLDAGVGCVCERSRNWRDRGMNAVAVLNQGLDVAQALGAKAMRCFMGSQLDREGGRSLEPLMETLVQNLRAVRTKAVDAGVKIAIENHKDMQAWQLRRVIEDAGRDFVGANLDIGNPLYLMETPQTTLETLAPYTVTSHVRDTAVYEDRRGAAVQWTALGDGSVDLKQFAAAFDRLCPDVSIHLEIITGRPPEIVPFLEPAHWASFGGMPARDLARFVALAKAGRPFAGRMVIEDVEGEKGAAPFRDALVYQQRSDLERSLRFAQQVMSVGGAS